MTLQDNRTLLKYAESSERPSAEVLCNQPDNLFNLEEMLPLDLIRVHTKTDDVPSATDEQLALYRRAAVESAEQYTSMYFSGLKSIIQPVDKLVGMKDRRRGYFTLELDYPVAGDAVYVYGRGPTQRIQVAPNSRKVRIQVHAISLDVSSSCCRGPCDGGNTGFLANPGMKLTYQTGFKDICEIPAGIKLGMLKFIAWSITHPGDEILAVRNRSITRSSLVDGTNNVAWASGAIELWRQYDPDYI